MADCYKKNESSVKLGNTKSTKDLPNADEVFQGDLKRQSLYPSK